MRIDLRGRQSKRQRIGHLSISEALTQPTYLIIRPLPPVPQQGAFLRAVADLPGVPQRGPALVVRPARRVELVHRGPAPAEPAPAAVPVPVEGGRHRRPAGPAPPARLLLEHLPEGGARAIRRLLGG